MFYKRGVTLMEVAFMVAIVGVAITALVSFAGSATRTTVAANEIAKARTIGRAAHEWATALAFTDLKAHFEDTTNTAITTDANGRRVWTPSALLDGSGNLDQPLDPANGAVQSQYSGWTEVLTSRMLNPGNLLVADTTGTSQVMEIVVSVRGPDGREVCQMSKVYANF